MVDRRRTRSNPPPPVDEEQIEVLDELTGLTHYVGRDDPNYDKHLADWNRRNNIPPDVHNSRDEEQPRDQSDHQENNDNNNNDDANHVNNDHLSLQQLADEAINCYALKTRRVVQDKGLAVLYSQEGEIDIHAVAFTIFNFSPEETRAILNRYLLTPFKAVEKGESGAVQIVEGLIRLGIVIDKKEVDAFQKMSDKFRNQHIDLALLVDKHARELLDVTFAAQKKWLQLSDEEIDSWYETWPHYKLAKVISTIWASKNATGTKNLMEQIRKFDFELDHPKMRHGREGEQQKIAELNALFFEHPLASYADVEWQKGAVKCLIKKFPAEHCERLDVEASLLPKNTVKQFIICWKTVRFEHSILIEKAKKIGCTYQINTDDKNYKNKNKRQREGEVPEKASHREEKRQKEKRVRVFVEKGHCTICGMTNHKRDGCFIERDKHPDRNTELEPWHHSTKGKLWMDVNQKNGPFCSREYLLNGDRWTPSGAQSSSKYEHILVSSVIDAVDNIDNITSDFLTVRISLPISQTVNRRLAGVEAEATVEAGAIGMLDVGQAVVGQAVVAVNKVCKALLDSGCLVGDCMSQHLVDELHASHLVVNIYTTICSGFDNHCSNTFPSLLINISFINETNALEETFLTRVIIIPKSPIEKS